MRSPIRILHVISSMDPEKGGVSEAVRLMVKSLISENIISEVVSIDDPGSGFLTMERFPVHAMGPGKTGWYYNHQLSGWLKNNLNRFDVVIVHGLWQYHTFAVYRQWKKVKDRKPRLFVMPHGMLDPYFQKDKQRRLKAIRNKLIWRLLEKKIINKSDAVLYTCETEMRLAPGSFRSYKPRKAYVVGLGVESAPPFEMQMERSFSDACKNLLHKNGYFLFLGRIHPKKGVDLLIKSYKRIRSEVKELPVLVIAGPGMDTAYGKMIKTMVEDEPVIFPGMLTGNAKWGAVYGSEAFILPSHQENFGIAVTEALACSVPVLISNKVNIWREIENLGAGIVENDSEEGAFNLLSRWEQMSSFQKKEMRISAKAAFEAEFSFRRFTARMKEIIVSDKN